MTINVTKGDNSTRSLAYEGGKFVSKWLGNEKVLVYQNGSELGVIYGKSSDNNETMISGELENAPASDQDLTFYYLSKDPSYSGQSGRLDDIGLNCDFYEPVTVTAGNFTVDTENMKVEVPAGIAFTTPQQAIVRLTLLDGTDGTTKLNASDMKVTVDVPSATMATLQASNPTLYAAMLSAQLPVTYSLNNIPANTYDNDVNGPGVLYVAIPDKFVLLSEAIATAAKNAVTLTITAVVGSSAYTYTNNGFPFENGKTYKINMKMKKEPVFSVGSTKKVFFSPGNLKYTRASTSADWSIGTWSFMTNQWDVVETSEVSDSYGSETEIGLFGWGSSGFGTAKPYSTSIDNNNYCSGITIGTSWAATQWAGYDWGYHNAIGSYPAKTWRTLTANEWEYLLNASGNQGNGRQDECRFAKGEIHDRCGLIIFPDGFIVPAGVTVSNVNSTVKSPTTYSDDDWTKLADAGCAFLPAAGDRSGTQVYDVNNTGSYWSSTSGQSSTTAYCVFFSSDNLYDKREDARSRSYGYSVRLVRDAN